MAQSIDLLPQLSEDEIYEIEEQGKRNFFGVFIVLIVVLISIVILGGNLVIKMQHKSKTKTMSQKENEIVKLQYVEIKQKSLNNKFSTYEAVEDRDFYSDIVLNYLMDVTEQLSTVDSLFLDQTLEFEVSGSATSYRNVARLWHEMSRKEDYFEYVNLGHARQNESKEGEDGGGRVKFSFSGRIKRESIDKLREDMQGGESDS
jgi:Tfp pilus assembly protein PilN